MGGRRLRRAGRGFACRPRPASPCFEICSSSPRKPPRPSAPPMRQAASSAAAELRRHFPGIIDNAEARSFARAIAAASEADEAAQGQADATPGPTGPVPQVASGAVNRVRHLRAPDLSRVGERAGTGRAVAWPG